MRPLVVDWLIARGLPGWLAPDYVIMGGIAGLVAGFVILRYAKEEERSAYALALALAYVGAYAFGTLFELVRSLPAFFAGSGEVALGRAAWGGLLGAVLTAWIVIRAQRRDALVFFDRVSVGIGLIFGFVRIGCFLGGCDFGRPSALPWAVAFPPASLAAEAHVQLGWVRSGAPSLNVHPTQLYEAGFGFLSAAVMAFLLANGVWRGRLAGVWIALYAVFRFGNELLRGDTDRGVYGGLSTAQIVSLIVFCVLIALAWRPRAKEALA